MSTALEAATAEGMTEMAIVMAPVAATAEGVTEMAVVMAPAASTAEGVTEMAVVMAPSAATVEDVTKMTVVIGMSTEMAPAAVVATVAGKTETTGIAKFAINSSKADFLALPCTDRECDSVDSEYGLWVCVCVCLTSSREGLPSDVIPIAGQIQPPQRLQRHTPSRLRTSAAPWGDVS